MNEPDYITLSCRNARNDLFPCPRCKREGALVHRDYTEMPMFWCCKYGVFQETDWDAYEYHFAGCTDEWCDKKFQLRLLYCITICGHQCGAELHDEHKRCRDTLCCTLPCNSRWIDIQDLSHDGTSIFLELVDRSPTTNKFNRYITTSFWGD